jgi:hypothetical protein
MFQAYLRRQDSFEPFELNEHNYIAQVTETSLATIKDWADADEEDIIQCKNEIRKFTNWPGSIMGVKYWGVYVIGVPGLYSIIVSPATRKAYHFDSLLETFHSFTTTNWLEFEEDGERYNDGEAGEMWIER